MGMTRDTKTRRLAELDERIAAAGETAQRYEDRAKATRARETLLRRERAWVEAGPVIDPMPGMEPGVPVPEPARVQPAGRSRVDGE